MTSFAKPYLSVYFLHTYIINNKHFKINFHNKPVVLKILRHLNIHFQTLQLSFPGPLKNLFILDFEQNTHK